MQANSTTPGPGHCRFEVCCHPGTSLCPFLPGEAVPLESFRISGSSQPTPLLPKDRAATRAGMLALTPLPLYQSELNFPYSALGETISGCGRRVEHICWLLGDTRQQAMRLD